jgi:hypothetical protein
MMVHGEGNDVHNSDANDERASDVDEYGNLKDFVTNETVHVM